MYITRFGESPRRDDLVLLCEKGGTGESIFVFFPDEPKIGVRKR